MKMGMGMPIPNLSNLPGQRDEGVSLTISYPSSAFCTSASDPSPTVSGNVGAGIFSAGVGLQFLDTGSNTGSSTGVVDISNTVTGTYTITYTDTDNALATTPLEVVLSDNATFSYSASSYDPSASNPTPTTVLAGGTFTAAPSGLVFVDTTTGEINLSTSTIGSYTITYNTSPVGNLCPSTSTQPIAIAVAGLAQIDNLNSMSFDGTDDFISGNINTPSSFTNLTISCWVNINSLIGSQNGILSSSTNSGANDYQYGFALEIRGGPRFRFKISSAGSTTNWLIASNISNINQWHHIACVTTPTQLELFVNGVSNGTEPNSSLTPSFERFFIGSRFYSNATQNYFDGSIDEVGIFNTALTEAEILSIYNATAVVDGVNKTADLSQLTTPPVAWYRM